MKKILFQLEPLTCPSCIKKIESALSKTKGVDLAEVMFNSSKVKVQIDEASIEAGQVEKIIKNLGYSVLSSKVS